MVWHEWILLILAAVLVYSLWIAQAEYARLWETFDRLRKHIKPHKFVGDDEMSVLVNDREAIYNDCEVCWQGRHAPNHLGYERLERIAVEYLAKDQSFQRDTRYGDVTTRE